jgi:hypothetical protein
MTKKIPSKNIGTLNDYGNERASILTRKVSSSLSFEYVGVYLGICRHIQFSFMGIFRYRKREVRGETYVKKKY